MNILLFFFFDFHKLPFKAAFIKVLKKKKRSFTALSGDWFFFFCYTKNRKRTLQKIQVAYRFIRLFRNVPTQPSFMDWLFLWAYQKFSKYSWASQSDFLWQYKLQVKLRKLRSSEYERFNKKVWIQAYYCHFMFSELR